MGWYKCVILGENFPGTLIGVPGPVGFYVNRWVEAASPEAAEQEALATLRTDANLQLPEGVEKPKDARVNFEEIHEVDAPVVPNGQQGFAFFPMESS